MQSMNATVCLVAVHLGPPRVGANVSGWQGTLVTGAHQVRNAALFSPRVGREVVPGVLA